MLSGEFTFQMLDNAIDIFCGTEITIPKDAEYGLTNRSDNVSVIEFTYLNPLDE